MKRRKGFTLIELLAVIVILAVIALIATPLIMNTINDARDSAMQRSVQNIQHAVEQHYMSKKVLDENYQFSMSDFDYKGEKYDKMNIVFNDINEAGVAIYKDNKCFYIAAGSSNVIINEELEEFDCLTSVGSTIGFITEQLLANNETYTYMNGTYLKGMSQEPLDLYFYNMNNWYGVDEETARTQFFNADGSFNLDAHEEFVCTDPDMGWGYDSVEECHEEEENTAFYWDFGPTPDEFFAQKALNNYVWYNGFIWRIMGKNADGSIRLITEENVTAIAWGAENTAQNYGSSYIKDWLNTYFINNLKDTNGIVNTNFCEDNTLVGDENWDTPSMRTTCSNPVKAKAGLLSLDELNMAGGYNSYLANGQYYWTLTPFNASYAWDVDSGGSVCNIDVAFVSGVRAVISIDSDITITGGNGTLTANADTEYVLGQTLDEVNGKLKDKSGSGEYVTFDGKVYRIVEHTDNGTKLILDGFYTDGNGEYITTNYGTSGDINTMFSAMKTLLAGDTFLNWLAPTRSNEIKNTTWYRGEYWTGGDYKNIFANQTNGFESKIGLIHVGEMLASQSLSIISKNYSAVNSLDNTTWYWALTPFSASSAWTVNNAGNVGNNVVAISGGARAVILIDSDITITGGNGTLSQPYEV